MKRYMVRRTRSFIKENYASSDETSRKYLEFADGSRSYFPDRLPKTVKYSMDNPESDAYAQLYSESVVKVINSLNLPRYGLGNYIASSHKQAPTEAEQRQLKGLSRAGRRLMGFSRTNLFKRLESSSTAFVQSLERHILRNYIYLYAIENGLDIPIGPQDANLLDTRVMEEDVSDAIAASLFDAETEDEDNGDFSLTPVFSQGEDTYRRRAAEVLQRFLHKTDEPSTTPTS